jgi:uncharacterized protein (TIGR02145 family)
MEITVVIAAVLVSGCIGTMLFLKNRGKKDVSLKSPESSVLIGRQVWMESNLDVEKFSNNDMIKCAENEDDWISAANNKEPAWCFYKNNSSDTNYGKLYNWFAINDPRGLAPKGYKVPGKIDWEYLFNELGGEELALQKIKSEHGWVSPHSKDKNGTNETKFNALAVGSRKSNGEFPVMNFMACGFWCNDSGIHGFSSETRPYCFRLDNYDGNNAFGFERIGSADPCMGFSVRCLKE